MPPEVSPESPRPQLIVFSDDWGRHPSSCQHLVRHLLDEFDVLWVNTIGMRKPRWSWADFRRGMERVRQVFSSDSLIDDGVNPEGPVVISPVMYPGFRNSWQRRLNQKQIARSVLEMLGETWTTRPMLVSSPSKERDRRRIVLTTLPITADLVGHLDADRWVYYCVDDFSVWPGVDHRVMDVMERELVAKVDSVVAASQVLVGRIKSFPRQQSEPVLLVHGVEAVMWREPHEAASLPRELYERGNGMCVFWGVSDERLDLTWLQPLVDSGCGLTLVGPWASGYYADDLNEYWAQEVAHRDLPAVAAKADVLIMPYIDAPVTRAMQPLKLLEYLATMKPAVVRDLPSTRAWADCCDVVDNAEDFVRLCLERAKTGTPPEQVEARNRRLPAESWSEKARRMRQILLDGADNR